MIPSILMTSVLAAAVLASPSHERFHRRAPAVVTDVVTAVEYTTLVAEASAPAPVIQEADFQVNKGPVATEIVTAVVTVTAGEAAPASSAASAPAAQGQSNWQQHAAVKLAGGRGHGGQNQNQDSSAAQASSPAKVTEAQAPALTAQAPATTAYAQTPTTAAAQPAPEIDGVPGIQYQAGVGLALACNVSSWVMIPTKTENGETFFSGSARFAGYETSTGVLAPHPTAAATNSLPSASGGSGSNSYKQVVLDRHNIHRANHSAPDLVYDDGLATLAKMVAATCVFKHNETSGVNVPDPNHPIYGPFQYGYGQNIEQGTSSSDIAKVISGEWYSGEVPYYQGLYAINDTSSAVVDPKHEWGHMTQMVWYRTTSVGCWTNDDCAYTVCNYGPPGNMGGFYNNVGVPKGDAPYMG